MRDTPELAVAGVEIDDGLNPLVVVIAECGGDVDEVPIVRVLGEVGGIDPEDVGQVARVDVEWKALPVLTPRDYLDLDGDVLVLLLELLEGVLVSRSLDAAIDAFAENGYDKSSLRSITSRAGVDVALVKHFFGGKEGLLGFFVNGLACNRETG